MSTALTWQTVSIGSAETENLAELLGRIMKPPAVLELISDLGGGKTTFARGLARGLGSRDVVSSPTFTLSKIYKSPKGNIYHFDFYRLTDAGILKDQLAEALAEKAITIVEWSGIVKNVLPAERLSISFQMTPDGSDERRIIIRYPEELSSLIKAVESQWEEVRP